ncbi:MAG TPA: hypothetical protein VJ981_09725 [Gammaproteobacteria bacterium]|nr:hypothetical protein [Gammaproteobacteria bacterium]
MKKYSLLLAPLLVFSMNSQAHEHDFPTIESVRYVVGCMADLGGQNEQNLYTCTCRHDFIAGKMSFEEYDNGTMQERYSPMPGEKGGVVRDNAKGKEDLAHLNKVKAEAAEHCPVVKALRAPSELSDKEE